MYNRISDNYPVVAKIHSQLADDTALTSDWVNMGTSNKVMFVLNVGATDTTVDAKIQSASSASGTGAADITGLAVTQIAGTGDNRVVILEVREDELAAGHTHAALVVTVGNGTTGAQVCAIGIGDPLRGPASKSDLALVAEIVTL